MWIGMNWRRRAKATVVPMSRMCAGACSVFVFVFLLISERRQSDCAVANAIVTFVKLFCACLCGFFRSEFISVGGWYECHRSFQSICVPAVYSTTDADYIFVLSNRDAAMMSVRRIMEEARKKGTVFWMY